MKSQQFNYWIKVIGLTTSVALLIVWLDAKHLEFDVDWSFALPTLATISGGVSAYIQIYELAQKILQKMQNQLDKTDDEVDSVKRRLDDLEEFSNEVVRLSAKVEIFQNQIRNQSK